MIEGKLTYIPSLKGEYIGVTPIHEIKLRAHFAFEINSNNSFPRPHSPKAILTLKSILIPGGIQVEMLPVIRIEKGEGQEQVRMYRSELEKRMTEGLFCIKPFQGKIIKAEFDIANLSFMGVIPEAVAQSHFLITGQ